MSDSTVATITVVADPLSVSIGSNAIIIPGPDNLTYQRHFVVLVVDASGRAKGNVDIVPSIDLPTYFKGRYVRGTTWFPGVYDANSNPIPRNQYGCPNEDLNRNAVNETGEDVNFNGSLEPRKSDAAVSMVGGSENEGRRNCGGADRVSAERRDMVAGQVARVRNRCQWH